jgi:hypothetical protein
MPRISVTIGVAALCFALAVSAAQAADTPRADHVGKPLPEYTTGGECLFCHRGPESQTWQSNPHAWTVRAVKDEPHSTISLPADATHLIGYQHARGLKLAGYGHFALAPATGATEWDAKAFAERCVGCHTTGVDPKTASFSNYGLDCYACHGVVPEKHTAKNDLAWLSQKMPATPRQLLSICDQCHLRGGVSQSTGRPYPNNFVAGDDLFLDFKADLKLADDRTLDERDRHVYEKTRAVLERGSDRTCISCHRVHAAAERKPTPVAGHSKVCGY